MSHSTTHGPAVQLYLVNDPRRISPFNRPNHAFAPSGDPSADALYLRCVNNGEINRFYVTVTPGVKRNVLNVTIYDKHNDNVVLDLPVKARNHFSGLADYYSAAISLLRSVSTQQGAELRLDLSTINDSTKAVLSSLHENNIDTSLFQEGVAVAQQGRPINDLWHDEQRRGWALQMGTTLSFTGATA